MPHEYNQVSSTTLDTPDSTSIISCAFCHADMGQITGSDLKCTPCRNRTKPAKLVIQPTVDEVVDRLLTGSEGLRHPSSPIEDSNWSPLSPDAPEREFDDRPTACDCKDSSEKTWTHSDEYNCTHATSIQTDSATAAVDKPSLVASLVSPSSSCPALPTPYLLDITQLRALPQGRHCLVPGAVFNGYQTNGTIQYDVVVNLLEVDFSSDYLCGQLRIRGLTSECQDITTYFDAEILGPKHGFLTRKWDANDADDMRHWAKFPAFRRVKADLQGPRLNLAHREYGAIFMRWKERFIVSGSTGDTMSGASFAGFYYICIDFEAPASGTRAPTLHGFYHHLKTTADQELILVHEPQAMSPVFEAR